MSYSIKHSHVMLTCEQMRAIISTLETVRDAETLMDAQIAVCNILGRLKQEGILSEHDYLYEKPAAALA